MGQQQLLLLVLSTVIVGLATVAGIQAFSENQRQAEVDALTQRAVTIATDLKAADSKPNSLGGTDLSNDGASTAMTAAGYTSSTPDAQGASDDATCSVTTAGGGDPGSGNDAKVICGTSSSPDNAPQKVTATLKSNGDIETTVNSISS
jgi:hypothetical protein